MVLTRMTPQEVESLARGWSRIVSRDGSRPPRSVKLTGADRAAFERAKKLGYLVWKKSQHDLYEIWWYWCFATGLAFIAIKARRRWGFIEFEMRDADRELTEAGVEAVSLLLGILIPDPINRHHRRSACRWDLPLEGVHELAGELARVAREQVRPRTR